LQHNKEVISSQLEVQITATKKASNAIPKTNSGQFGQYNSYVTVITVLLFHKRFLSTTFLLSFFGKCADRKQQLK
jgi:hypothetical protein